MIQNFSNIKSGKAGNLQILKDQGFLVPNFIVLPTNIQSKKELLQIVNSEDFNSQYFAVRSSVDIEDGDSKSFAGHFYSAIGIDKSNLFVEYQKVVESYHGHQGFVIIQEFINSTKSGVIFTDDGTGNIVINSNFGLCKTVVEGSPCDEFTLNRKSKIISQCIESQKQSVIFDGNKLVKQEVNSDTSLTNKEAKEISKTALQIENNYGKPQDIEWCFYQNKLYILQTRPITAFINTNKQSVHYDSANIAESYSGIISPLTISFATNIYKTVYINLLKASGASSRKIRNNIHIFNNLVESFYGRIYYNMNNWYLMMSFIPGYSRNKENLEDMITSNVREPVFRSVKPSVLLKLTYPLIVIFKMIFFPLIVKRFKRKVQNYLNRFRKLDIRSLSFNETIEQYQNIKSQLLEKWHVTVENDFIMMTYLGILKKKINEFELHGMLNFDNKSAQQILALKALSDAVYSNPELKEHCVNTDSKSFEKSLKKYSNINSAFENYFKVYGGRFANELKLESSDIEEDKQALLQILNLYKNYKPTNNPNKENKPNSSTLRYILKRFKKYASQREELRLLRSNCFSVVRKLFLQIGRILKEKELIENIDDIFYLKEQEVLDQNTNYKKIIKERKLEYENYKTIQVLPFFSICEDEKAPVKDLSLKIDKTLQGKPCSPGKIQGKVRVFKEYYLPENIDFDIMVSKNTDPGWVTLIALSKGLIIEHGGILSHAAIVSRELGIPTVIGVDDATETFKDLQKVVLNGDNGSIQIIS
jgi:phosphohistidine swiveling domain-containing protein